MKGHHCHHSSPLVPSPVSKRRCTALAAAVPALVVCSILVPLAFLLGLHRSAYGSEERAAVVISTELGFGKLKHLDGGMKHKLLKDVSKRIISGSSGISGEKSSRSKAKNLAVKSKTKLKGAFSLVDLKNDTFKNSGLHTQRRYQVKDLSWRSMDTTVDEKENQGQEVAHEENPKSCELEYGSYCLWSVEHKEVMKDATVKRLKDQLFMARAHYPSIAKMKHQEIFARELKQNIQEHERMLSDTIADADLPPLVWSSHIELLSSDSCWCSKHKSRGFSTDNKAANGRREYQQMELKPSTVLKDNDAIIDRIQKSTRELKQGPIGKNLSSTEKRKFLINTLLGLTDSKEVVYSTLDAWVAFEQDFPLASIKQALLALEKEEQWHRIVQVIKWMLSKGQGNTIRTYEQLVCALEKDNRAEEAHRIWQKKIAHDLHSVPWRFCHLMLAIYYRNNRLDRLVKLFKELEACGRKPPSKDIIRKVEDAYEMLGLLEEKKDLLYKYKDLYNKPSDNGRKKGREFKKAEKNQKAADGSKQRKLETSENLPVHSCPSDEEPDVTS